MQRPTSTGRRTSENISSVEVVLERQGVALPLRSLNAI